MKVIGLTGGIGSGKTMVASVFLQLGVPVYDADKAAKNLYDLYPELTAAILSDIAPDAADRNGKIDRKKLAEIVFKDPEKLAKLNSLVHPMVRKDFKDWLKKHNDVPFVVKEAAILFESGAHKDCDFIIAVQSPRELRVQRVRERDRKTKQEVEDILARQLDDEERNKKSDFVIVNDEKEMILPQVLTIYNTMMKNADLPARA